MYRSNSFTGSIAGAVLEATSEEPKIAATEIPDSVLMMFVVFIFTCNIILFGLIHTVL